MNEKIKALAQQATKTTTRTGAFGLSQSESKVDLEKFAELVWKDGYQEGMDKMLNAQLSNPVYEAAMDAYYENKWAHRFD
jgi:hypothetical protein